MGLTNLIGKYRTVNVVESTDDGSWRQSVEIRPKEGVVLTDIIGSVSRRAKSLIENGHSPESIYINYKGEDRVPLTELIPNYESRAGIPRTLAGDTGAGVGLGNMMMAAGVSAPLTGLVLSLYRVPIPSIIGGGMVLAGLALVVVGSYITYPDT